MKRIIISVLLALVIFIFTFGHYTENEDTLVITNNTSLYYTIEINHYTFTSNEHGDIVQTVDHNHDQLERTLTNYFQKSNTSLSKTLDLVIHVEDDYYFPPPSNNQSLLLEHESNHNLHDMLIERGKDHYHIIIRRKHVFEQFWDYLYGFVKGLFKNQLIF